MRPSDKRDGMQEIRIGRHRDKLEEIRESLRAFEHAESASTDGEAHGRRKSDEREAVSRVQRPKPNQVRPTAGVLQQADHQDHDVPAERNHNMYNVVDPLRVQIASPPAYAFERMMARHSPNNNIPHMDPPHYNRPPPPAYDATPTKRMTPVAPDNVRTHLHIKTSPRVVHAPILHHKSMAPPPPGKSTVSIEMNSDDSSRHMNETRTRTTHNLYHTTLDNRSTVPLNSIVSINVASPHKTRLNLGERSSTANHHFMAMPSTKQENDALTRVYMNYTDELRNHPHSINFPSTSSTNYTDERMLDPPLLLKPPNLDITFQKHVYNAHNSHSHSHINHHSILHQNHFQKPTTHHEPREVRQKTEERKRVSSPIPPELLERLQRNERTVPVCKPNMFCFYMEQHVERLLQQYREREKRMRQLEKEMNAADLPPNMRQKMLELLQQKESRYTRLRRQKMSKDMFTILQHIGVGAFGKVSLVKKNDSGKVFAMKTLEKADVIMKQQAAHVKAERDILAEADSPWIVRLFFSFQDQHCLYFIMEYVPGGDMMQLLINKGIFEESLARFYIAELSCAIEYVHSVGFIHRDIKPDNILIDQYGHIKLTDFGLCTGLRWTHDRRYYGTENEHHRADSFSLPPEVAALEKNIKVLNVRHQKKRNCAHSIVGTGNYMAPEVITRSGHTQLCDWWSVGVILYEMVFGRPPFMSMNDDASETQYKIINWRMCLDTSARAGGGHLSPECISIIKELICDVDRRLGAKGAGEVKIHSWFKNIDFANLRQTKAEFIPRVEHAADTSNFESIEINETGDRPPMRAPNNNPAFYEFTFRHFFDMDGLGCPSLRPMGRRPSLRPLMENDTLLSMMDTADSSHV